MLVQSSKAKQLLVRVAQHEPKAAALALAELARRKSSVDDARNKRPLLSRNGR
jgi:hypothetical protein